MALHRWTDLLAAHEHRLSIRILYWQHARGLHCYGKLASMDETSQQSFFDRVYEVVRQIPPGKVISYGQIATLLGSPRAARQVGWALHSCPEELPWQRVVMADGSVTGGEWAALRRELLVEEGVGFLASGRVDMKACRWAPSSLALSSDDTLDEELRAELAEELASLEVPE